MLFWMGLKAPDNNIMLIVFLFIPEKSSICQKKDVNCAMNVT
jgi:hypothetical protein